MFTHLNLFFNFFLRKIWQYGENGVNLRGIVKQRHYCWDIGCDVWHPSSPGWKRNTNKKQRTTINEIHRMPKRKKESLPWKRICHFPFKTTVSSALQMLQARIMRRRWQCSLTCCYKIISDSGQPCLIELMIVQMFYGMFVLPWTCMDPHCIPRAMPGACNILFLRSSPSWRAGAVSTIKSNHFHLIF